jgi:hypothetical protein
VQLTAAAGIEGRRRDVDDGAARIGRGEGGRQRSGSWRSVSASWQSSHPSAI